MFDFDVGKLVVIGTVALIVIGPKDLPRVLRQVGNVVGKMRRMASEFQGQFMDAMREADVENIKKEMQGAADLAKFDVAFDPIRDVKEQITAAVEGDVTPGASTNADAPAETPEIGDLGIEHAPPPEKLAVEAAFEDAPVIAAQDPLEAKIAAHDSKLAGDPEPVPVAHEEPAKLAEKRA